MKSPGNYNYNLWNIISYFSGKNIILPCIMLSFHSFGIINMVAGGSEMNSNAQYSYHNQFGKLFRSLIKTQIKLTMFNL